MDTLSQLLDDIHLHGAEFLQLQLGSPWALRLKSDGQASFHIVVNGSLWLHIAGEPPQRLDSGDMVVLPRGQAHQLQSMSAFSSVAHDLLPHIADPVQRELKINGGDLSAPIQNVLSGYFRFDTELAKPLIQALPDVMLVRSEEGKMRPWLQIGLQFVANEILGQRPAQQAVVNRMADILFIEVMRDYIEQMPVGSGSWLLALRDGALSTALSAMHGVPEHNWTVPELAAKACLSRSAFADRFNKVMGQTPLAYLTDHRMRLACWQLAHTQAPITSIAEAVGYGFDTAFSQAFKRSRGRTPTEFRREALRAAAG